MLKQERAGFIDLIRDISGSLLFILGCALLIPTSIIDYDNAFFAVWGVSALMVFIGYPNAINMCFRIYDVIEAYIKKYRDEL